MCKRTKHLSIQDDCWIFRIQAEDFTRGGDKFRGVELRPPSELCIHSSISGGQIHNLFLAKFRIWQPNYQTSLPTK